MMNIFMVHNGLSEKFILISYQELIHKTKLNNKTSLS